MLFWSHKHLACPGLVLAVSRESLCQRIARWILVCWKTQGKGGTTQLDRMDFKVLKNTEGILITTLSQQTGFFKEKNHSQSGKQIARVPSVYFPCSYTPNSHTTPKEALLFDRNFLTVLVHSYLEMSSVLSFCAFRHRGFATSTCCVFTPGHRRAGRDGFPLIQINNCTDWSIPECPAKTVASMLYSPHFVAQTASGVISLAQDKDLCACYWEPHSAITLTEVGQMFCWLLSETLG